MSFSLDFFSKFLQSYDTTLVFDALFSTRSLFRLLISSVYSMFSADNFATSSFSFSSFNLIKVYLFATFNSAIFSSLWQIFLLIFFGLKEFKFWSDSPSFCTHNSCSSFKSESSSFIAFILSSAITFFLIFPPEDILLKYLPLNLIQKVLIEVFEFWLAKALIQLSVQNFPMKACYHIWH